MKGLLSTLVVVLILGSAGGAGYWYYTRPEAAGTYRTAPVRRTDIVSTISSTGTLVPEEVVDVGTQVNGQIASFGKDKEGKPVDYRSEIDAGSVLALIDDALYAADVSTSSAQLAQARSQVKLQEANREQARARLEQARRDWERAQKLGQSEALAQADYDAAKSAYEQAVAGLAVTEASIGQANAQVQIAESSVQRSQRNLAYCTIRSPVDGVIIDRRVDIGQTVVASFNAPSLFLIAKDLRRMEVLVQVNEADIGNVHPGQAVTFLVDAYQGEVFTGEVRKVRLNATMTQNVVTYTVEILTENPDLRLLPYLTANVSFIVDKHEQVLAVPNAALRWAPRQSGAPAERPGGAEGGAPGATGTRSAGGTGGGRGNGGAGGGRGSGGGRTGGQGPTVWILADGKPKPVKVRAGLTDGIVTEVESADLPEGAEVIVAEIAATTTAPTATAPAGASPFTPQMPRGGRGGR